MSKSLQIIAHQWVTLDLRGEAATSGADESFQPDLRPMVVDRKDSNLPQPATFWLPSIGRLVYKCHKF